MRGGSCILLTFEQTPSRMPIYRWSQSSAPSSGGNSNDIYKQDIQRPYNKVASLFFLT